MAKKQAIGVPSLHARPVQGRVVGEAERLTAKGYRAQHPRPVPRHGQGHPPRPRGFLATTADDLPAIAASRRSSKNLQNNGEPLFDRPAVEDAPERTFWAHRIALSRLT